ncbi:hypothetical protein [Olivibacter sitiensis]|uniref:hypothetical protein n=1 Tax=Olivibacter sitiensis TaxID=376470 RepID=UPI00042A8C7B|nr:hypothetical protein [Olivibacter sitiensis]
MEENLDKPGALFSAKKKKLLQTNRILSLSALFVSVSTLFILVYQTHLSNKMYYLEEKAQKMAVLPYLQLGTSYDQGTRHQINLENNGIGPALIKSLYVHYQDSVYAMDLANFILEEINPNLAEERLDIYYTNLSSKQLIPANSKITLVGNANRENKTAEQLYELFNRKGLIGIAITYTSIYEDQTWTCFYGPHFPVPSVSDTEQAD